MILGTSYILRITLALIYKPMTMQNKKRGCYKGKRISIIFFCFWVRHTATVQLTTHSSKAFRVKLTEKWSSQKPYQEVFKIEKKTKKQNKPCPKAQRRCEWILKQSSLCKKMNPSSLFVCVFVISTFSCCFFSHCHISNHKISPNRH